MKMGYHFVLVQCQMDTGLEKSETLNDGELPQIVAKIVDVFAAPMLVSVGVGRIFLFRAAATCLQV